MELRRSSVIVVFLLALLGGLACEGGHVADVSLDECASGRKWVGGDEESDLMHPGKDCIGCHADEGEGPRFLVAGTVYRHVDAADDCFGVEGATVRVEDTEGRQWDLVTNEAGNFYLEPEDGPLTPPIRARVEYDGKELLMATQQGTGACATCHTQTGSNDAAGRIIAP